MVHLGITKADHSADDNAWIDITGKCRIWPDRAAFTIQRTGKDTSFAEWKPYSGAKAKSGSDVLEDIYGDLSYLTLLHNAIRGAGIRLRLRLIGSVECDDAIKQTASKQVTAHWPFEAERTIYRPNRFAWREIDDADDLGRTADPVDDADDAYIYAKQVRDATEHALGHGSIVLRGLHTDAYPGVGISGTGGRKVDLLVDGGVPDSSLDRHAPIVVSVTWDFREKVAKTELVLDTPALRLPK